MHTDGISRKAGLIIVPIMLVVMAMLCPTSRANQNHPEANQFKNKSHKPEAKATPTVDLSHKNDAGWKSNPASTTVEDLGPGSDSWLNGIPELKRSNTCAVVHFIYDINDGCNVTAKGFDINTDTYTPADQRYRVRDCTPGEWHGQESAVLSNVREVLSTFIDTSRACQVSDPMHLKKRPVVEGQAYYAVDVEVALALGGQSVHRIIVQIEGDHTQSWGFPANDTENYKQGVAEAFIRAVQRVGAQNISRLDVPGGICNTTGNVADETRLAPPGCVK